jgi:hypothetical protein
MLARLSASGFGDMRSISPQWLFDESALGYVPLAP